MSFGGPVAHLGYFRNELVEKRKWVSESQYADLVALCQFLPGPGSSQVGFALGLFRAKLWGGAAAWLGFTMPSALIMIFCAYGFASTSGAAGWLVGLKIVAVAVVAHAVWGMAVTLCPDKIRKLLAFAGAGILIVIPNVWTQVSVILLGGMVGMLTFPEFRDCNKGIGNTQGVGKNKIEDAVFSWTPNRKFSYFCLFLFILLLVVLPIIVGATGNFPVQLVDSFYRSGSLVFGGGHVVLPLLESEVVSTGWLEPESFLAGYGAAQAVPGPLFTFAAYLGAAVEGPQMTMAPWVGGMLCLLAIFLPAWLLILGVLPFWDRLRQMPRARGVLAGANAAVVGLLLAALYDPVWVNGVKTGPHFALTLGCYFLLAIQKLPSWVVVLVGGSVGALFF